ncbi:hypothetical protein [Endozoicomonas sp. ALE010]|uniref:hypothetical protein n=1 Tax=Endozoicomonas sp. ALE010 TaxID=3403081 RepID=UPI003BB556DD
MKYQKVLFFGLLFLSIFSFAESDYQKNKAHNNELVMIKREDYISLVIGNYVNGKKSYDTSAWVTGNTIRIKIYRDTMNLKPQYFSFKQTPEELKKEIESHLINIMQLHGWDSHYSLDVSISTKG